MMHRNQFPALMDQMGVKSVVEIGIAAGGFARVLLESNIERYIGIDCWNNPTEGDKRDEAYKLLIDRRVEIIEKPSAEAVGMFADESVDMVYIDAMHDYESVLGDMVRWWPKCRMIFAGHDYGLWNHGANCPMGTIPAVERFAEDRGLEVYATGASNPTIADRLEAAYAALFVEAGDQGHNIPSFYIFK